jgi:hypothetical protein
MNYLRFKNTLLAADPQDVAQAEWVEDLNAERLAQYEETGNPYLSVVLLLLREQGFTKTVDAHQQRGLDELVEAEGGWWEGIPAGSSSDFTKPGRIDDQTLERFLRQREIDDPEAMRASRRALAVLADALGRADPSKTVILHGE